MPSAGATELSPIKIFENNSGIALELNPELTYIKSVRTNDTNRETNMVLAIEEAIHANAKYLAGENASSIYNDIFHRVFPVHLEKENGHHSRANTRACQEADEHPDYLAALAEWNSL